MSRSEIEPRHLGMVEFDPYPDIIPSTVFQLAPDLPEMIRRSRKGLPDEVFSEVGWHVDQLIADGGVPAYCAAARRCYKI